MSDRHRRPTRARDDRGDSLIEILIAVVIIALAAGPLIGALFESIAASAEHRGFATSDTLLKSFAETAVSEIQNSKLVGTAYEATTTPSYRLVSNPSKLSGPAGTTVTVFVTGFPPGSSYTVTVGGKPATVNQVTQYGPADARLTFVIPGTLPATPSQIAITSGGGSAKSLPGTGFQETTSTPTALPAKTPYRAYEIEVASVQCWTRTTASFATCTTANDTTGLQLLTFSAKGPPGGLGTVAVVVRDPIHT